MSLCHKSRPGASALLLSSLAPAPSRQKLQESLSLCYLFHLTHVSRLPCWSRPARNEVTGQCLISALSEASDMYTFMRGKKHSMRAYILPRCALSLSCGASSGSASCVILLMPYAHVWPMSHVLRFFVRCDTHFVCFCTSPCIAVAPYIQHIWMGMCASALCNRSSTRVHVMRE